MPRGLANTLMVPRRGSDDSVLLSGTIFLQAVPAAVALKQVIFIETLDAGFPPLIKEDAPERLEIAPALTARRELVRERKPAGPRAPRD